MATIGLLATAGFSSAQFQGFFDKETRDELKEAIENKDYDTWKKIQDSRPKITDYIDSQEKFEKFLEMQSLAKEGKTEEADAIREELGLPEIPKGQNGKGIKGQNKEAREAIENSDYQAWVEAMPEDSPMRKYIENEEDFNKLVEMHEARENNDDDRAEELREELGLPDRPNGTGKGMMMGR